MYVIETVMNVQILADGRPLHAGSLSCVATTHVRQHDTKTNMAVAGLSSVRLLSACQYILLSQCFGISTYGAMPTSTDKPVHWYTSKAFLP